MIRHLKVLVLAIAGTLGLCLALYFHDTRVIPLSVIRMGSNFVDHMLFGYPAQLHTPYWIPFYNGLVWSLWATLAYGIATIILFRSASLLRLIAVYLIGVVMIAAGGSLVVAGVIDDTLFRLALPVVYFLVSVFFIRAWPAK